jgi:hypothetical protein
MNRHTFQDAVSSRREALANEVDEDDEDEEFRAGRDDVSVEGEEDEGHEKVQYTTMLWSSLAC